MVLHHIGSSQLEDREAGILDSILLEGYGYI